MRITRLLRYAVSFSVVVCLASPISQAAIIASTDFNARTLATTLVANDTASNLNWTTNGIADPGNMSAVTAGGAGQILFNSTTLTQNMFAPLLNVGNGDTFWRTTVPLTILPSNTVTLESVAFQYTALSGGGVINVNRVSDFTISLFDPSSALVEAISITDALSGSSAVPNSPTLTFNFTSPIALTSPGTYTLRIQGGDYAGTNETGNHAGIDNLTINGQVTPIPEPTTWALFTAGLFLGAWRVSRK